MKKELGDRREDCSLEHGSIDYEDGPLIYYTNYNQNVKNECSWNCLSMLCYSFGRLLVATSCTVICVVFVRMWLWGTFTFKIKALNSFQLVLNTRQLRWNQIHHQPRLKPPIVFLVCSIPDWREGSQTQTTAVNNVNVGLSQRQETTSKTLGFTSGGKQMSASDKPAVPHAWVAALVNELRARHSLDWCSHSAALLFFLCTFVLWMCARLHYRAQTSLSGWTNVAKTGIVTWPLFTQTHSVIGPSELFLHRSPRWLARVRSP